MYPAMPESMNALSDYGKGERHMENTEEKTVQKTDGQMAEKPLEKKNAEQRILYAGRGIGNPTPGVIRKLAKVRKLIADTGLSKGGKNEYTGFSYFELSDFLPTINRYCEEVGILAIVTYDMAANYAYMTILDSESDGYLSFNCPLGAVSLQGAQGIQQAGAMQTYARRYLYLTAFEIAEADSLDADIGKDRKIAELQEAVQREQLINEFVMIGGSVDGLAAYLKTTKDRLSSDQLRTAIGLKKNEAEKKKKDAKAAKTETAAPSESAAKPE